MRGKHEAAQVDEVLPLVVQQVAQTAHLRVHDTDVTPVHLHTTTTIATRRTTAAATGVTI